MLQLVKQITAAGAVSIPIAHMQLCTYHCYAPPTPGRAEVGISGDLQELFDKFPTPWGRFHATNPL